MIPGFRGAAALILAVAAPLRAQDSLPLPDSAARVSPASLSGSLLQRLPIDDPRHALPLVPGVVLRAGEIGIDRQPLLVIRGGRNASANVYIDGAPVRFQTFGTAGIGLPLDAIAEAAVVTGVAPVTLGDAGGGAILYRTRSGGARWDGDVRWESDEPFGRSYTVGYNRIAAQAGGPIAGRATALFSVALQGQGTDYRSADAADVPTYFPSGTDTTIDDGAGGVLALPRFVQMSGDCADCDGLRRPLDWSTARRVMGKIELPYGAGSGLAITGFGADLQEREFPGSDILNPAMFAGRRAWSTAAIVNWRHEAGIWRGGPIEIAVNLSQVSHRDISGPLEPDVESTTRDPSLGIAFANLRFAGASVLELPVDERLVRDLRTNSGTRGVAFFGGNDPGVPGRANPYGLSTAAGWWTSGQNGILSDFNERRWQARAAVLWRPTPRHEISLGVEGERSRIAGYASSLVRQLNTDAWQAEPRRAGLFVSNRIYLAGATLVDIGLRYDRSNAGGDIPIVPAYISSSGPPLWNVLAATDDTAYKNSVERVFDRTETAAVFSPRVRLVHPLSFSTTFRLEYSRTAEPPAWGAVFAQANSDVAFTNTGSLWGRDVGIGVTSLIEAGIRFGLGTRGVLDVAVYQKDPATYAYRIQQFADPRDPTRVVSIPVLTLLDNVTTWGGDVAFEWRNGWLSATAAYSMVTPQPTHALALRLDMQGSDRPLWSRGLNAAIIATAQSGEPYTRVENTGFGTLAPAIRGRVIEQLNASRLPWTSRVDLRVAKSIVMGGQEWSIYVDARNLLNTRNLRTLFAETGSTVNDRHRQQVIGDPDIPSGEYGLLRNEAQNAGALEPDGTTVNLTACAVWGNPVNCVALTRVERRFGDGNGLYTLAEQQAAFNAYYDDFFGAWRFYGPGRTLRIGVQLGF